VISRFALDAEAFKSFPKNLLDDCAESTRMAERIVREIGLDEYQHPAPASLPERLSWAIRAVEDLDAED